MIKANETPAEREKRLKYMRQYSRKRRANETPEQREKRLEYGRKWYEENK